MMLHKSRTPSTSILKYFLLIPIISGALFLNACTQENPEENPSDISGTSQKAATENGTSSADQAEGTDIYTVAEVMPAYPGGNDAMINFLGENIEYPAGCKKEGVEGTVFVSFVVDESGNPTQIKVLRSPDDRLSANAMEVVGKMPTWSPGENGGKPVKVQYSLPIKYKLN